MAVTHDQGAPVLAAFAPGGLEVVLYLGLQSLGEHPTRSLAGDLVEIQGELFAALSVLM